MKRQFKRVLRTLIDRNRCFYLFLGSAVKCPICGWNGRSFLRVFDPNKPAYSFVWPFCRSSERRRFADLTLKDTLTTLADKTLHFAPEESIV